MAKFPHTPILHYACRSLLKENNGKNSVTAVGLCAVFVVSWWRNITDCLGLMFDVKQYYFNSFVLIGSFNCWRVKPPLGGVLLIDLLGKELTFKATYEIEAPLDGLLLPFIN